ncbi:glycosyltransferase [bacterium]|nr:glycosyltransferase [bacterium]
MARKIKVSIIVPAYNEEENILPLFEAFADLQKNINFNFELIVVDDGSTDKTAERTKNLLRHFQFASLISYSANRGKTYAVLQGFEISKGDYIVIFDADLQFDPKDIPPMVEKLDRGADVVAGYKVGKYQKPLVSGVYNLFGKLLFGVPVKDMNALKTVRREVLEQMPFRPDWHRYIVIWAHKNGFKIVQHPVKLRPRKWGKSKYRGFGRILIGFFDMMSVWFQLKFVRRPMLFFGSLGLSTFFLAFIIGIVALILRFGYNLGYRPLLTLIAMLANIGLLLIIGGFLGEMVENISGKVRHIEEKMSSTKNEKIQSKPYNENRNSDDKNRKRRDDMHSKKPNSSRKNSSRNRNISDVKPIESVEKIDKVEPSNIERKSMNSDETGVDNKKSNEINWGRRKRKSSKS